MNTRNAIVAVTIMASLWAAPLAAMAGPQHNDQGRGNQPNGRQNQTVQHNERRDDRQVPQRYDRRDEGRVSQHPRHGHERYGREWYVGRHHYRQVWDFYRCVWMVVRIP